MHVLITTKVEAALTDKEILQVWIKMLFKLYCLVTMQSVDEWNCKYIPLDVCIAYTVDNYK